MRGGGTGGCCHHFFTMKETLKDKYHDCGHRPRINDQRKRYKSVPQMVTDTLGEKAAKVLITMFVQEVERRAEEKMLITGKLEGAHYAAMKQLAQEWT